MLSSISPLGERSRGMSFTRTAVAYVIGSVVAAGAFGALLGALGSLVPDAVRSSAPVLGVLALPDRGVRLELVEEAAGALARLRAVRRRGGDLDARLAERHGAGAVLHGDGHPAASST